MPEQDTRPCHVPEPKECAVEGCDWRALSFREKCWEHLNDEERNVFREEIIGRARSESLAKADLSDADLQDADLRDANLQDAFLVGTTLRGADIIGADLRRANLGVADLRGAQLSGADLQRAVLTSTDLHGANLYDANLQMADLCDVNLRMANLCHANLARASIFGGRLQRVRMAGCDLQEAKLNHASLQMADFREASLQMAVLEDANLQGADLKEASLQGAFLEGVIWRDSQNLTAEQVGETGEYVAKNWEDAEDAYRRLKNYFHDEGRYDDESWAFVMEKTCARRAAWQRGIRGKLESVGSLGWCVLANYGTRWLQAAAWAVGIIVAFTLSYWPSPWRWSPGLVRLDYNGPLDLSSFWTSLYFSVVTFATLGFGDIKPANGWGIAAVIGEVLCGYVMLGTLVALIARKMTR